MEGYITERKKEEEEKKKKKKKTWVKTNARQLVTIHVQ